MEGLCFGYGRAPLFVGTDLALAPGNVYGLLGLNGAGKSTLLRLVSGLLFPAAGRIDALGHEPARREPSFLSQVFLLTEEISLPPLTDREYVSIRAPFYPRFDRKMLDRCLVELEVPRGRKLTELSYGQKKEFLLAFGIATDASLLLLDEPTNGLDIPAKGVLRRLVAETLTDRRIVVLSTHQVRDVESLIDSIVILHSGRVLLNRTLGEVASNLRIGHSTARPDEDADDLLYTEPAIGGFAAVWRNANGQDGMVDLEVLFKAVVTSPGVYTQIFDGKRQAE
jgi:ABC-2 type transport system ATP-binding protein